MIGVRIGIQTGVFALIAGGVGVDSISGGSTSMTLNITDDWDPAPNSGALVYTCTVTNTGAAPLVILALTVTLDSHVTYVSSTAGGFTTIGQSGGVVTASLSAALPSMGTCVCTITVTTPATAQTISTSGVATAANAPSASDTETTSILVVAKDATSGIRCPINAAEWASVMSIAGITSGGPSLLWLFQEAASPFADSIGTFTGTAAGSAPACQQAISGWTRLGVTLAPDVLSLISNSAAGLPDTATTSQLLLAYYSVANPPGASDRVTMKMGTWCSAGVTSISGQTAGFEATLGNPSQGLSGFQNGLGMRPYILQYDRTNGVGAGYSAIEHLVPTYNGGASGKAVQIGAGTAAVITHTYVASFFAGAAEMSSAQIKRLLQALGWTVTWT